MISDKSLIAGIARLTEKGGYNSHHLSAKIKKARIMKKGFGQKLPAF